ncbi:MAG: glycosyl hydrolase-related protein, partial [Actinomycetota bacterium]|nr:glycosyl hydrolase-related protein [Actinomycetota bacterium]
DISQSTEWHETEKFLKVAFPLDVKAEQTLAETQFGYHRRPTHTNTSWEAAKFETSMHRWVLAEEPGFGVALVNDSTYGFDVTRPTAMTTEVRLSLLRAPRFPDPETDQGVQTHRYGLVIGADVAAATEAGAVLNTLPRHVTGAQAVEPLVTVSGEGLVISSVKLAADRSGDLVVRVYESTGARTQGELRVGESFGRVEEISLVEDPIAEVSADGGVVALSLGAFEVRTLRFHRN